MLITVKPNGGIPGRILLFYLSNFEIFHYTKAWGWRTWDTMKKGSMEEGRVRSQTERLWKGPPGTLYGGRAYAAEMDKVLEAFRAAGLHLPKSWLFSNSDSASSPKSLQANLFFS